MHCTPRPVGTEPIVELLILFHRGLPFSSDLQLMWKLWSFIGNHQKNFGCPISESGPLGIVGMEGEIGNRCWCGSYVLDSYI